MISASQEDYIEFIFNNTKNNKELKAIDIANHFKISRASVTEALNKLSNNGLIIYEGRKGIKITQKGILTASKINEKHQILFDFFVHKLNIDKNTANKNACQIEHVIDDEIIEKIALFNQESQQ